MAEELVWAIHSFDAENPDEISFKAGEAIVVLEKDDMFQDGWWQGRNVAGQAGLFPESYTSKVDPNGRTLSRRKKSAGSESHTPVMKSTLAEIDTALQQNLNVKQSPVDSGLLSARTPASEDDNVSIASRETAGPSLNDWEEHAKARQVLAAKAKAQIEKAAQQEKEKAQARQLEQAKYLNSNIYDEYAPVSGLEFSDESDAEDDVLPGSKFASPQMNGRSAAFTPVNDLASSVSGKTNRASFASQAHNVPLPATEPSTPNSHRHFPVNTPRSSAQLAASAIESARASSPAPSNSSRRSRKVSEVVLPTGTSDSLAIKDDKKKSMSRSSSRSSMKRRQSISSTRSAHNSRANSPNPNASPDTFTPIPLPAQTPPLFEKENVFPSRSSQQSFARDLPSKVFPTVAASPGLPSAPRMSSSSTAPDLGSSISSKHPGARDPLRYSLSSAAPQTPVTATSESRPGSQMGSTAGGATQSIKTNDTSPRSSIGKSATIVNDPRQWSVEQVVEWGKTKNFDQSTLNKFQEHEISGDILLEFDVNTLKEIDLPAFGRRVHIYNAIKELKRQIEPPATASAPLSQSQNMGSGPVSPAMSGYMPDTPASSQANFSPSDVFSPPPSHSQGRFANGVAAVSQNQDASHLQGLGFEEEAKRSLPMSKAATVGYSSSRPTTAKSAKSTATHKRSHTDGTIETYHTVPNADLAEVREEAESPTERQVVTDSEILARPSSRVLKRRNDSMVSVNSKNSDKSKRSSWYKSQTDQEGVAAADMNKTKSSSSFFNGLRGRKPAPRVPSTLVETERSPRTPPTKRSTRLFGLGSSTSAPPSPIQSDKKPTISKPLELSAAKPTQTIQNLQPISSADVRDSPPPISSVLPPTSPVSPVDQIGTPEVDGWLRKKTDQFNNWKTRYVLFKNMNLYFMKSPREMKVKGIISTVGYKVLPDPDSARGFYGFKMVHPVKVPHYFSSEDPLVIRRFMKALTKSSIKRDERSAVITTSNVPTIPLEEAQAMFPPPRPPSPTSRDQIQKARLVNQNPNTLTPKDAAILMSMQKEQPAPARPQKRESKVNMLRPSSIFRSSISSASGTATSPTLGSSSLPNPYSNQNTPYADQQEFLAATDPASPTLSSTSPFRQSFNVAPKSTNSELTWVNSVLPGSKQASDLTVSFRNGQLIYLLVKGLSGQSKAQLEVSGVFKDIGPNSESTFDHVDPLLDLFDFLLDLSVPTEDVSVAEILRGDAKQTSKLLHSIQTHFS